MHCTVFGIFCCNSSAHVLPVGLAVQVAKHKKKHRTRLLWQVALVPKNCLAKPYSAHKATRLQLTATRACCSGSQTQKTPEHVFSGWSPLLLKLFGQTLDSAVTRQHRFSCQTSLTRRWRGTCPQELPWYHAGHAVQIQVPVLSPRRVPLQTWLVWPPWSGRRQILQQHLGKPMRFKPSFLLATWSLQPCAFCFKYFLGRGRPDRCRTAGGKSSRNFLTSLR